LGVEFLPEICGQKLTPQGQSRIELRTIFVRSRPDE